jgi:hypothetical protein
LGASSNCLTSSGSGTATGPGYRQGCTLVALATRRTEPFYLALGYERSATYLRKVLPDRGLHR